MSLANSVAGRAEVDLYSDDGLLEPGTKVGTLAQVGTIASSLANITFTASGITLTANTNYWIVLKALTGQFDWSWNLADTGTGTGFQDTWGESNDSGADWFTYNAYATQMNVSIVSAATVPAPSTFVLWGMGFGGVALSWSRVQGKGSAQQVLVA